MTLDAGGGGYHRGPLLLLSRHLECEETETSIERTASLFETRGLAVWVHSVPEGQVMRAAMSTLRIAMPSLRRLPDCAAVVSGHGHAVAALREKLRKLMQQYLGTRSQRELMRDLNQAVREQLDNVTC